MNDMTERDAYMILQEVKELDDSMYAYSKDYNEALEMALFALKKQVPMKAVGTHYAHMRCPNCNHRIPSGGGSSSRRRDNWCNYCGQKIDWSKENERTQN